MCGIAGIFNLTSDKGPDPAIVGRMIGQLAHRGPDGEGIYSDGPVCLGHRRLAIIDTGGSPQPMTACERAFAITFNGEIYNYRELRAELTARGHRFVSNGDTEVILAAYAEWGQACLEHLAGMFAFALWDAEKQQIFLARDRLGEKPLYYALIEEGGDTYFAFASEFRALLEHGKVRRRLRYDALADYLALGYVPDPKTILCDMHKLAPGHFISLRHKTISVEPQAYWHPHRLIPKEAGSEPLEALQEHVTNAVESRTIADVPIGVFLSSGLDSTLIAALTAKLSAEPVSTFTIGSDNSAYDEREGAEETVHHIGSKHRQKIARANPIDAVGNTAQIFGEPFADHSSLPTSMVSALAASEVKVALSGDGADELFCGYRRYLFHLWEEKIRRAIPGVVRKVVFGTLAKLYPKLDWAPRVFRAKSTFENLAGSTAEAYFNSVAKIPDRDRTRLYSDRFKHHLKGYHPNQRFKDLLAQLSSTDPFRQIQYIDLMTYLPGDILTKLDRASMYHSLEARVPFLDHRLVEWSLKGDANRFHQKGTGKFILRQLAARLLPPRIVEREKRGFVLPMHDWLRHELRPLVEALETSEALKTMGLIDMTALGNFVKEHLSGRRDHQSVLWSLLVLEGTLQSIPDLEYPCR